jgi:hypothetical protein
MMERAISCQEVLEVVQNAEITFRDPKGNPCSVRTIDGRRIKVVLSKEDPSFVITVIDLDS